MDSSQVQPQPRPSPFKRTAISCQHCQHRKMRCDRRVLGSPCTNCRLDGMECLQGQSKPRSRAPKSSRKKKDPIANSQPTSTVSTGNSASQDQTARDGELPSFIKALPAHLTVEDISYLRHRGIFQIPATGCRNEILRAYFHFVHPLMPLLDVETFLGPMLAGDCSDKISLMLLYAVLCSGAAHIEIGVLQALGYETRKSARKAFFDRARVSASY